MISLLVTARKDSKYLAKFITSFVANTSNFENVELLVFIDPEDTWNKELFECFKDKIKVIPDTTGIGRGGSHIFYQEAGKHAKYNWLWYLCDDHYLHKGYDQYITGYIWDNQIDSTKINVIAPMCDNSGRISHIISRKVYQTIGFGNHGNVDSYINEMCEYVEAFTGHTIPYTPDLPILTDLGMDKGIMVHSNRTDFDPVEQAELFKSDGMKQKIKEDAQELIKIIKEEHLLK